MSKVIIVATFLAFWSCDRGNMCDNEIVKEVYSPDKKFKAIIFKRDCGATTGTSSQLTILKGDEELENQKGNTFVVDDGEIIKIKWENQQQLTVYYDSLARTFEMKDRREDIRVKYKRQRVYPTSHYKGNNSSPAYEDESKLRLVSMLLIEVQFFIFPADRVRYS